MVFLLFTGVLSNFTTEGTGIAEKNGAGPGYYTLPVYNLGPWDDLSI
jgi:hypothetical protein